MSIHKKMLKFHAELKGVKKTGFNPHFKSQHWTLDEIVHVTTPILNKLGLYVTHAVQIEDGVTCMTTFITDAESGDKLVSWFPMTLDSNPQKMASQVTYYKRYNMCGLFNIAEPDDDGEAAAQPTPERPAQKLADDTQRLLIQDYIAAGAVDDTLKQWLREHWKTLTKTDAAGIIKQLKEEAK